MAPAHPGRRPTGRHLDVVPTSDAGDVPVPDGGLDQRSAELADQTFRLLDKDLAGSSPLQAELWVAGLVDTWAEQVLDGGSDPVEMLSRLHLQRAREAPTPAARVLVGALAAVVGIPEVAVHAEQVARDLDRQGVRLPRWARGLGERRFKRAAVMDHELDDGHTIFLAFAYPDGEQYTVAVYVDVNTGTRVKDVFVGEPMATVERTIAAQGEPGQVVVALDAAEARARIEQAFERLDELLDDPTPWTGPPLGLDEIDDLRRFVEAHVAALPTGGVAPTRFPADEREFERRVDGAVDAFLASAESVAVVDRYGDDEVEHVAQHLAEYAVDTGGDARRISVSSAQMALWSAVPDSGCFDEDDADLLLDVAATWAMWALRERGLPGYVDATVDGIVAAGSRMVELLEGVEVAPAGEVMALAAAMSADGVRLDDDRGVAAWMDRYYDDVSAGRRPPVEPIVGLASALSLPRFLSAEPPELDERAPDLAPARRAMVTDIAAMLDVPDPLRPRVEEVLAELVRVCDAVLDEHFLAQAAVVLGDVARVAGSGLGRGRADIWAGGILYALGQDEELWSPYSERYVPPDQLARIVGASRASLMKRANDVRDLVRQRS